MLGGGSVCWVSAPEQKPRPVPVKITHQVSLSSATSAIASTIGIATGVREPFIRRILAIFNASLTGRPTETHSFSAASTSSRVKTSPW